MIATPGVFGVVVTNGVTTSGVHRVTVEGAPTVAVPFPGAFKRTATA